MNVLVAAASLMFAVQANPDALSEAATKLAQQQRYDQAAALWSEALKTSPAHFPSLFNFAFMRYSQKRFADAEPLLARAAKSRPNDFNTHYLLGGAPRGRASSVANRPCSSTLQREAHADHGRGILNWLLLSRGL